MMGRESVQKSESVSVTELYYKNLVSWDIKKGGP